MGPALRDVKPGSAFMKTLDAAPMPAGLKLTSLYTCHDEYLWPYTTSVVAGATNVQVCSRYAGHFTPFWDDVLYARIRASLRGEGAAAPTYY